jgi:hypothetical protein
MSSLILNFYRYGQEIPEVKALYSSAPYLLFSNPDKAATLKDAEPLLKSAQKDALKDRVQWNLQQASYIVDRFFRVLPLKTPSPEDALKLWNTLRSHCQMIVIGTGLIAIGLTVAALRGASPFIEVALFAGIVAACCFAGWGYQRFTIADHQVAVWRSPGEDFAQRRTSDLELSLEKICQNKCHYHGRRSKGTLLGIEILYRLSQYFKNFAPTLLTTECGQAHEQQQWVVECFTSNPLMIDFFKENPYLTEEEEWEDIQQIRQKLTELEVFSKNLQGDFLARWKVRISRWEQRALRVQQEMRVELDAGFEEAVKKHKIAPETAALYHQRLLQTMNEELFGKISRFIEALKEKLNHPKSFLYVPARYLLIQAYHVLIENKTLPLRPYATPQELIFDLLQGEFHEIIKQFSKNFKAKARALAPQEEAYQEFLNDSFKPS